MFTITNDKTIAITFGIVKKYSVEEMLLNSIYIILIIYQNYD